MGFSAQGGIPWYRWSPTRQGLRSSSGTELLCDIEPINLSEFQSPYLQNYGDYNPYFTVCCKD